MLKIKTYIRRFFIKNLKLHRPGSLPYITGDSFRSISQHILDESIMMDPKKVMPNEIIFIRTNYLKYFFEQIYQKISYPFILITHNEDMSPDSKFLFYLNEDKIIHWFAENCIIQHPKITPIPIGLYNQYNDTRTQILKNILKNNKKRIHKKNNLVAYGFSISNNEKRRDLKEKVKNIKLFTELNIHDYQKYIEKLNSYKFVLSPEGNGIDCHRTWESILSGVVPILIKNSITAHWKNLGLPIFLIETWDELDTITEVFLNQQYDTIMNNHSLEPALFDYWEKEIFKKII